MIVRILIQIEDEREPATAVEVAVEDREASLQSVHDLARKAAIQASATVEAGDRL